MHLLVSREYPVIDYQTMAEFTGQERLFRTANGAFLLLMSSDWNLAAEVRIIWLTARDAISWLNEAPEEFDSFLEICAEGDRRATFAAACFDLASGLIRLIPNVGFASFALFRPWTSHFRSSPLNGHSRRPSACLKSATSGLMHRSNFAVAESASSSAQGHKSNYLSGSCTAGVSRRDHWDKMVALAQCRPKLGLLTKPRLVIQTGMGTNASGASDALAFSAHDSSRVVRLAPPQACDRFGQFDRE